MTEPTADLPDATTTAGHPIARVLPLLSPAHLDRDFDYLVPPELDEIAQPGVRVRVRFAGRLVDGYLLARLAHTDHTGKLVKLDRVVSSERVLTPEILHLATTLAARYAGTRADVLRLAIPPRHARTESGSTKKTKATPAEADSTTATSGGAPDAVAIDPAAPELDPPLSADAVQHAHIDTTAPIAADSSAPEPDSDEAPVESPHYPVPGSATGVEESPDSALPVQDSGAADIDVEPQHHAALESSDSRRSDGSEVEPGGSLAPGAADVNSESELPTAEGSVVRGVEVGAWGRYVHGGAFLGALGEGKGVRAAWQALPGEDWARRLAELAAVVVAAGRSAILLVPDQRDLDRVLAECVRLLGDSAVGLAAGLGPAARYRRWLAVLRGSARVVVGTRSAVFSPAADLGLIAIWDDGDDTYAEPRAPYPHAREVAMLRAHETGAAFVAAGFARTAEVQAVVDSGWAHDLVADRAVLRKVTPRISAPGDTDIALERDPVARAVRIPGVAFAAARAALKEGAAVLVQVPRRGYVPALACAKCRTPARCRHCNGPLALPDGRSRREGGSPSARRGPAGGARSDGGPRRGDSSSAAGQRGFADGDSPSGGPRRGDAGSAAGPHSSANSGSQGGWSSPEGGGRPDGRPGSVGGGRSDDRPGAAGGGRSDGWPGPDSGGRSDGWPGPDSGGRSGGRLGSGRGGFTDTQRGLDGDVAQSPSCRWCGLTEAGFRCPTCASRALRAVVIGAVRTAEELGRAFPGVPIRGSGGGAVLDTVEPGPQVVVATVGAEPVLPGGYGVALLLDGWALLSRADLRTAEDALRRWMSAAALVRAHGQVIVMAEPSIPTVQALVRWDPVGHARAEVAARAEVGFPPAVRMAAIDGAAEAITELLATATLPDDVDVLGPVPLPPGARKPFAGDSPAEVERMLLRVHRSQGAALARALTTAQAIRSTHRSDAPLRVQIDPIDIG